MKYILKNIVSGVSTLFAVALFLPTIAQAAPATCTDGTTGCGFTNSYNMTASCSLSGPDIVGGNRILGGERCSIGGTDDPGFFMNGNGQPNNNTPYSANSGSTPPGWTYNKSPFAHSSIPSGEFQDDPYYIIKFFGGPASIDVYPPDDDASLQVGTHSIQWTGCTALVTDVFKSGCPSRTFSGSTNVTVNPGDSIVFNVTNRLRPNNGSGTWGGGSANINLTETTQCLSAAYYNGTGGRAGGGPVINYHPTAAGQCSPEGAVAVSTECVINSFTATPGTIANGGSSTLVWNVVSRGKTISIDNNVSGNITQDSGSTSVSPNQTTAYTLRCGTQTQTATVTVNPVAPTPIPAIGASVTSVVTIPVGQDSITVPLYIWNAGDTGSVLSNIGCNKGIIEGIQANLVRPVCAVGDLTAQ